MSNPWNRITCVKRTLAGAVGIIIGTAIVIGIWYEIRCHFQLMEITATRSLVLSVHDVVADVQIGGNESTWQLLIDDEYTRLLRSAHPDGRLDLIADGGANAECIVDSWGNKFYVAVKRSNGNRQYIVSSPGPDKTVGTEDDIVSPENLKECMAELVRHWGARL